MKKAIKGCAGVLAALCFIMAGCNSSNENAQQRTNKRDTVVIKAMAFVPAALTIQKGDTVVWINQGIVAHDVSAFPDRNWHSDTLNPHDTFEKVFSDSAGYFCSIHPTMKGKILIKE